MYADRQRAAGRTSGSYTQALFGDPLSPPPRS